MKTYDEIVACLRKAADRHGGKAALMRFLDAKKATFYRAMDDEKPILPAPDVLCEWLDKLRVSLAMPGEELDEYELVPRVEARAGAGESWETSGTVAGLYAFRREFLDRIHASAKRSVTMFVSGDSMEPLIKDGDMILVDQAESEPKDGLIYLVNLSGALMVKRLFRLPSGWRLHSDNAKYGHLDILGDELSAFKIFGRVRWFGRVL